MTDTQALTLRLDRDVHERLRQAAFNQRRPISELIREAVDKHLEDAPTIEQARAEERDRAEAICHSVRSEPWGDSDQAVGVALNKVVLRVQERPPFDYSARSTTTQKAPDG